MTTQQPTALIGNERGALTDPYLGLQTKIVLIVLAVKAV